jgi:hypothetical protein
MKFRNAWFIISITVMSVGVFYLVVHTFLVIERSNRAVEQQGHTLGDILTDEQIVLPFILSMPKVLWNFILDRVRDLGKAIRDEE